MEKNRTIYIFKHLWDSTDEEHPATIQSIIEHLKTLGIETTRKTVMADLDELSGSGFDIVCNKGRPNQYFVGNRYLELPELKLLTDAVQAAKFISEKKTYELIEKLSSVASPHQGNILKRRLYVDGKTKTDNEKVYYIVDLLHNAIIENTAVCFKYYEYNADKQKVHKHNGQVYEFSPYDLVWSNDSYYVFGYSESHGKELTEFVKQEQAAVNTYEQNKADFDSFAAVIRKHIGIKELTPTIVNEFVKKIIVHAPDKSSGHRRQKVDIVWNFIGSLDTAEDKQTIERQRKSKTA